MLTKTASTVDWASILNTLPGLDTAQMFHSIGFNVFPLGYGTKNSFPYPWGRLNYTRLSEQSLPRAFAGAANLAVMMGATSNNLFVLDCETPTIFEQFISELECRDVPICAVRSARGGHLYLRAEGVVQNIPSGSIEHVEVRGTNGYVLLPPSLHPTGVFYRFHRWEQAQPPLIDISQIDFLVNRKQQPVNLQLRKTHRTFPTTRESMLTRKTRAYLQSGDSIPEGSRNTRLFSAATDMMGCGFGRQETLNLLSPIATRSGLSLAETQRTLSNASIKICLSHKLLPLASTTPALEIDQEKSDPKIEALWAFAMNAPVTPGRKGDSERRILLAMVALYKRGANHQGLFRGSQREWLEMAHLSDYHSSEQALVRLQQAAPERPSVLRSGGIDKLSGARLWQIAEWVFIEGQRLLRECNPRAASVRGTGEMGVDTLNNADYLERGALGVNGYRIYAMLCKTGQALSLKQLASLTHLTVDTVRYHLREERPLRREGLVQIRGAKRNRLYIALPKAHELLNVQISTACGTLGKSAKRRQKHAQERVNFVSGLVIRRMERLWRGEAVRGRNEAVSISPNMDISLWGYSNYGAAEAEMKPSHPDDGCRVAIFQRQPHGATAQYSHYPPPMHAD